MADTYKLHRTVSALRAARIRESLELVLVGVGTGSLITLGFIAWVCLA